MVLHSWFEMTRLNQSKKSEVSEASELSLKSMFHARFTSIAFKIVLSSAEF